MLYLVALYLGLGLVVGCAMFLDAVRSCKTPARITWGEVLLIVYVTLTWPAWLLLVVAEFAQAHAPARIKALLDTPVR